MFAGCSGKLRRRLDSLLVREGDRARIRRDGRALARTIDPLALNVKQLGYDLARRLAEALPPPVAGEAYHVGLHSKPTTQADIESRWAAHWCAELKIPLIYHRKIWELAFVLQALWENGGLREGARGLGFGCGTEPIASYLAACGVAVTATDLAPSEAHVAGWCATGQHADHLDRAFHPHLVDRATFDRLVRLRFVDMKVIPGDLRDYDFCWSVCALEHLGSIAEGLAFVEKAMAPLRSGGVAVHTTEYSIEEDGPAVDHRPTVLFQRRHLEKLAEGLRAQGHHVAPLSFDPGTGPMDRFIDVPPWPYDLPPHLGDWLGQPLHLKLTIDGFVATCFGIIVRKA